MRSYRYAITNKYLSAFISGDVADSISELELVEYWNNVIAIVRESATENPDDVDVNNLYNIMSNDSSELQEAIKLVDKARRIAIAVGARIGKIDAVKQWNENFD